MARSGGKPVGAGELVRFRTVFKMKTTRLGKLGNRLGCAGCSAVRVGKAVAGALNIPRVFVAAAGLLLGLLLMGAPAEVNTWETDADGDLRLVDTAAGTVVSLVIAAEPSGRLEIFDDPDGDGTGEWKGICDDGLGTLGTQEDGDIRVIGRQEAEVACRQLGFSGGTPLTGLAVPASAAEDPSAYYLLDDLECSGSEAGILGADKCKHSVRGENNCGADEAFGVSCRARTSNSDAVGHTAVRGTETKTGVTVTADHSGIADADGKPAEESSFSYQWIRSDLAYNETEIPGATNSAYVFQPEDEENWVKVRISFTDDAGNAEQVESFDVGPVYPDLPGGSLRLIPTTSLETGEDSDSSSGLLQIFDDQAKRWKGICDDLWDDDDAAVACGQMGLSGGAAVTDIIWIGQPSLLFLLDDVECGGTEETLLECAHSEPGAHDCASWEYAGVTCEAASGSR